MPCEYYIRYMQPGLVCFAAPKLHENSWPMAITKNLASLHSHMTDSFCVLCYLANNNLCASMEKTIFINALIICRNRDVNAQLESKIVPWNCVACWRFMAVIPALLFTASMAKGILFYSVWVSSLSGTWKILMRKVCFCYIVFTCCTQKQTY